MNLRSSVTAEWVAVAVAGIFAAVGLWEIAAPLEGGHWASMAKCAIAGENMLRYGLSTAVAHYAVHPPPAHAEYYCRHPYAIYWMEAVARLVFGHHAWVIRLPAVVCSAATPLVLFRLAKAMWGPLPAAVATVGFAVVPIDLAFATFSSLEVPTILFGLLFCLGTVRVWQSGHRRDLTLAAVGALGASHSDWIGAVLVGLLLMFGAARVFVSRRVSADGAASGVHRRWLTVCGVAVAATLVFYALLVVHAGQQADLLWGAKLRSLGFRPLSVGLSDPFRLARRLMRLQWMVPLVGFAPLGVALPLCLSRLRTRPHEIVLVAWTVMASVQYLLFPQGADMHVFWPHYYGPCVALALGAVTSACLDASASNRSRWWRACALTALVVGPIALLARTAVPMLEQSRLTQGRFDERGLFIESGAEAGLFAEWATRGQPPDASVACTNLCSAHVEYSTGLAQLGGPIDEAPREVTARDRLELIDARAVPSDGLRSLARTFGVQAAGPFLRVDRAVAAAATGVRAVRVVERQPTWFERIFVTDHDLVRRVDPNLDAWATWQWADALGVGNTAVPNEEPRDVEELAAAFNAALAGGETERAASFRLRAVAQISTADARSFSDDVRLIGTSIEAGTVPVVTLLWETGGGFAPPRLDSSFTVWCRIIEPPPVWVVPVDPLEKEIAPPMTFKPSLWRPQHLYVQRFVWLRRAGKEKCRGFFVPAEPKPLDGNTDVSLW